MKTNTGKSSYRTLASFKNVLVRCPGPNDSQFRIVDAHCFTGADGKRIEVAKHVRRGDMYNGRILTKNFYIDFIFVGETFIADQVNIVERVNCDSGEVSLIIDVYKHGNKQSSPLHKLKVGSPTGEFLIPGTNDKYIKFEKLQVVTSQ